MNIKRIIMFAAAAVVSFAGTFAFVWLTSKAPESTQASEQLQSPQAAADQTLPGLPFVTPGPSAPSHPDAQTAVTEKRLNTLVYEIQEKIRQYQEKDRHQAAHQQRLQMAAETLKKDAENLKKLQIELASTVAQLKQQQQALEQTRVRINQAENANIRSIATTFDKMDSTSASNIVINMCRNNQTDDAVKIIYYMTERTAAKLLAELSSAEPKLTPGLCDKLKRVSQDN